jgi:hypothetical protein
VGTKTGWFRGFCSYYATRWRGEVRKKCVVEMKEDEMAHENFFSPILLYTHPSTFEKIMDSKRLVVCACVCVLIARATKLP